MVLTCVFEFLLVTASRSHTLADSTGERATRAAGDISKAQSFLGSTFLGSTTSANADHAQ